MNRLIEEAEQIIQTNATPRTYKLYFAHKRKIFFGPFSEIINTYQVENQELTKQISIKSSEKPAKNLRDLVKNSFVSLITNELQSSFDSSTNSLNEIGNILYEAAQSQEKQKRTDIQRYRTNITKYENKIIKSKKISIQKAPPHRDNRNQYMQKLAKCKNQLQMMESNLKGMEKENEQFSLKMNNLQTLITTQQQELEEKTKKAEAIKHKIQELREYRNDLSNELGEMVEKVQHTILLQRFGPDVLSSEKAPKIRQVAELKQEIKKLKEQKSQMESMKKTKMIDTIKSCQKECSLRHLVSYV